MAKIELNELIAAANEVITENQKEFNAQDNERTLVYTLAYNDGALDLMNKLRAAFFLDQETKIKEAADDKSETQNI